MPRREVALNEDNERQGEGSTSKIVFRIVWVQDQPDELHREADPEEEVELDQAQKDLVVSVHRLDATVRAKVLVHLPAKLGVDPPPQRAVGELRD